MSTFDVYRHISKRIDGEIDEGEKDLLIWGLTSMIEDLQKNNSHPSASLHLLISRLAFKLDMVTIAIKEARRACSCDSYNPEVEKAFEELMVQIPTFLTSNKVLKLSQIELRTLHDECEEALLTNKFFYEAIADAYSKTGDFERFQSIKISIQLNLYA